MTAVVAREADIYQFVEGEGKLTGGGKKTGVWGGDGEWGGDGGGGIALSIESKSWTSPSNSLTCAVNNLG